MNVKTAIFEGMQYAVRFPEIYKEGEQYPILFFLHGAGTRGEDINNIVTHSFLRRPEKWPDFKFIIVAPLCHKNTWFDHFETLTRFTLFIANQAYTDKNRIYLTGNSMGGIRHLAACHELARGLRRDRSALRRRHVLERRQACKCARLGISRRQGQICFR